MDLTSIIEIIVIILVIYLIIKFVVSPIIKIIVGIVAILIVLYILQQFFGFNLNPMLGPLGKYANLNTLGINLNWLINPANYYILQMKTMLSSAWQNVPKSSTLK